MWEQPRLQEEAWKVEWRPVMADAAARFERLGGLGTPVVPMPERWERELQTQMRVEGRTAGQAEDWGALHIPQVLCLCRRGPMGYHMQVLFLLEGHRIHWQHSNQDMREGLPRVGATSRRIYLICVSLKHSRARKD